MRNVIHAGMAAAVSFLLAACAGQRPDNLVPRDGRLAACPSSPNCVSSQAGDADHAIAPLHYRGDRRTAFEGLKRVLTDFERTSIVDRGDTWLHAECRSAVMGFVDDVIFSFTEPGRIHVRSASRLGYSDMGVNRRRIEQLRVLFEQTVHLPGQAK